MSGRAARNEFLFSQGGMYILDLVDYFGGGFIIYVMVITETIAIFWVYGKALPFFATFFCYYKLQL